LGTYVSMLRGINVGSAKRLAMEKLRQSLEVLGCEPGRTFIPSGNVVFDTGNISTSALSTKIETRILGDFGFPVPVVSRTAEDMHAVLANNPLLREPGIDPQKLQVMFLSGNPNTESVENINKLMILPERIQALGKEIYLYLPNGVSESKFMNAPLERILSVVPTTRNWKTVTALDSMCQDPR
jgi:uncharacterized protein (DUF1697 family)